MVHMVKHADSKQAVPIHGQCNHQNGMKLKVVVSLSQSLIRLVVTSWSLWLLGVVWLEVEGLTTQLAA